MESGIKYVKRFLRGKEFASLDHLNDSLMIWTTDVADQRIHGTTHRKPAEMFAEERALLINHTGKPAYVLQIRAVRHVAKDCMINFETNRYSVPFTYVSKQVEVQSEPDCIRIYHGGRLIAVHVRCLEKHQVRMVRSHYDGVFLRKPLPGKMNEDENRNDEVEVRDLRFYESLVEGGAV